MRGKNVTDRWTTCFCLLRRVDRTFQPLRTAGPLVSAFSQTQNSATTVSHKIRTTCNLNCKILAIFVKKWLKICNFMPANLHSIGQVLRTDIVMDVGESLNPAIDIGQVEGAFMQGMRLFTLEELCYSPEGVLLTRGPGMYKIPGTPTFSFSTPSLVNQ